MDFSCRWIFYSSANYLGTSHLIHYHSTKWLNLNGVSMNNVISSIRRVGTSTDVYTTNRIILFAENNFKGASVTIAGTTALNKSGYLNNDSESIIILGSSAWTFYE